MAKKTWLNQEIKFLYAEINRLRCEMLKLRRKITISFDNMATQEIYFFENNVYDMLEIVMKKKEENLSNKFKKLISSFENIVYEEEEPKFVKSFISNLSSEEFSEEEMSLLNMGLNFTLIKNKNKNVLRDLVVDIETSIKFQPDIIKHNIY